MKERCFLWLLAILLFYSCDTKQSSQETLFRLVPDAVDFQNQLSPSEEFNMYLFRNFYNGGGVAVGDVTGNGYPDLFFTGNMVSNRLYENQGGFQFSDVTESAGLQTESLWSTGASMGDVNQDGYLDIFVAVSGPPGGANRHNKLYINQKNGTFTEEAQIWGVADRNLSTHGVFFDYDMDGLPDLLVIANSLTPMKTVQNPVGRMRYEVSPNRQTTLYRNTGASFEDVTSQVGLLQNEISFPLSASISDVNLDGCPDVYIANDFYERDYLYMNQCDGTFSEQGETLLRSHSKSSMGSDIADLNQDGWPDIYVTDMLPWREDRLKSKMTLETYEEVTEAEVRGFHHTFTRNTLQVNQLKGWGRSADGTDLAGGDERDGQGELAGSFIEIGRYSGVEATDWSWSALIADFDLDGNSDIFVTNGIFKDLLDQDYIELVANPAFIREQIRSGEEGVIMNLLQQMSSEPLPNQMFRQHRNLTFKNSSDAWGLGVPGFSNGAAWADLDLDGDLDLVIHELNAKSSVYENRTTDMFPEHGWLRVHLQGPKSNRFGIGAHITAYAGQQIWTREQYLQRGFQSSVDPVISIGTGPVQRLDSLRVRWPDGRLQTIRNTELMDLRLPIEIAVDHVDATHVYGTNRRAGVGGSQGSEGSEGSQGSEGSGASGGASGATRGLYASKPTTFPGDRHLATVPFQRVPDEVSMEKTQTTSLETSLQTHRHQPTNAPDFQREPHLRQKRSSEGPAACYADITQNGLPDLYLGGGKDQSGTLWIQKTEGEFDIHPTTAFQEDAASEDVDCAFFDANGDGQIDLYVVSGGTSYTATSDRLQDRLYIHTGSLQFEKSDQILPSDKQYVTGSVVAPHDLNNDGAIDLFVGTRLVPFATGTPVRNYLLVNNGDGTFRDDTEALAPQLTSTEMVTDAKWADLNHDGSKELILATEWGPLRVFDEINGTWTDRTEAFGLDGWKGLWNVVEIADLNMDGYPDLIAGNHGENSLYASRSRVDSERPILSLFTGDPNADGWTEQLVAVHRTEGLYPLLHQPEYLRMMPGRRTEFATHESFAGRTLSELFPEDLLHVMQRSDVTTLSSMIFWNRSGAYFEGEALPPRAQLAPIYAIQVLADGAGEKPAFLAGGNLYEVKPNPGRMDALDLTLYWADGESLYSAPGLTPHVQGQIRAILDVSRDVSWNKLGDALGDVSRATTNLGESSVHEVSVDKANVNGNQTILIIRYGDRPVVLKQSQ